MRLILLGAPGAGKGTVSKALTDLDGSVQISTGDILRGAVSAGTELGKTAKGYMNRGELVPDELILGIMEHRLQEPDCANGFLLDGFPRNIAQADALAAMLEKLEIELDMVVELQVPREEIVARLTSRRTCSNSSCQAIYNVRFKPSKVEGVCDICGSATMQRDDETEEVILQRLETYEQQTAPLIEYYHTDGSLISVDGTSTDSVVKSIQEKLSSD